jgi:sulfite reductase beta subunit-like hemoprotein
VTVLPSEPAHQRLAGLYPQRQDGLWMQRMRVPGGRLTASQWHAVAALVRELTPEQPLHLTTRQDLEIHGLRAEAVPAAQRQLVEAGLTSLGACGDTIRNVTVCPCSGVAPGAPELLGLAQAITELLQSQAGAFSLPRKFKVSLSACADGCAQPWINDVGLVAKPGASGGWAFDAIVAGSLGALPATGIGFPLPLAADDALPFVLAALRLFERHGDRDNRRRARLRHVRQSLGDAVFLDLLERELDAVKQERDWPLVELAAPSAPLPARRQLHFDDGNIAADQAGALARLAGRDDLRLRLTNHHRLAIFGPDDQTLADAVAQVGLAQHAAAGPRVVACPGTRWCSRGLADTGALAAEVRRQLQGHQAGDLLIAISGCPNGCAHTAVADVGASGVLTGSPGQRREAWNVVAGGERGKGPGLALPVAGRLDLQQAAARIAALAAETTEGPRATSEVQDD